MNDSLPKPRSYAEVARRRVESLENTVYEKLNLFKQLSLDHSDTSSITEGNESNLINHNCLEIYNYLNWFKDQIQSSNFNNDLDDDSSTKKKRKHSKLNQNPRKLELTRKNHSHKFTIDSGNFSNLNSPKYFGPVKVGRYDLSFCLQLVVEVYCNKLDPDLFWLNREQVENVIRHSDHSLLKFLIIEASLNVSSLTTEEKRQIGFLHQDISSLIVSSYHSPSIDGVVALAFLALEEFLKYDVIKAKMYLSKAFRLADLLKVNPDFREDNPTILNLPHPFNSDKLWESLLLIHAIIFVELPGPPLGRCSTISSFSHVGFKELSFPTVSRVLEIPSSEKIQVQDIFQDFESRNRNLTDTSESMFSDVLVKQKRRTISGVDSKIHVDAFQIYMKLYQFSLEVQHQYFSNPRQLTDLSPFLPESDRKLYNVKLVHLLQNLPDYFKRPQIFTIHSIWDEFSPNTSPGQDSSTLGNLVYVILLSCLINVNYPHIWFHPQPSPLPDPEAWQLALKASDAMYKFFLAFSSLLQSTDYTDFLVFNLCDALAAVYTYLNAILHCPHITHHYRKILFHRAQTIVDEIRILSNQTHQVRHANAAKVLITLRDAYTAFEMPEEFRLTI